MGMDEEQMTELPGSSGHAAGSPIIFGEVLFDSFPDGSSVLGGAPFNVAWHLQGFGLQPLLVSRIGSDTDGDRVLRTMESWNMDTGCIQRDAGHPTGRVEVNIRNGEPRYSILPQQAYDFIDPPPLEAGSYPMIYCGSLALRHPVSREALDSMRERHPHPLYLDVNLRSPWWEQNAVMRRIRQARWVKLNEIELGTLLQQEIPATGIAAAGERLRMDSGLEQLVVTMGAQGAWMITPQGASFGSPVKVEEISDTVGAGDAFCAVTILGLLRGWSATDTLQRALEFAARICRQRGATAMDRALYEGFLLRWQSG